MGFNNLKRIISIFLTLVLLSTFSDLRVNAKQDTADKDSMKFDCESAILIESSTGVVLYEMNADKALPPASVTKIMTLLLVMEEIENGNLKYTDTVTTSKDASAMGGSQIFLKEGEEMSVHDMIKSVVIASANDAAYALAEHISGSEEAFVKRMNQKAKELGMKNTYFENTNGLDDTTTKHLASARDIAIMSRELIKYDKILEFSSTWMDTIRDGQFGLTNTNRLVRFFKGATGLKTGSTAKAKFCVSATAKRDNMHLICVVMGAPSSDIRNSIASKLLNWGFANYELYEDHVDGLNPIKIYSGTERYCNISSQFFACVIPKGQSKNITKSIILPDHINAPIDKNDPIGSIEYYLNQNLLGKSGIISEINITKIDFGALLLRILSKFILK